MQDIIEKSKTQENNRPWFLFQSSIVEHWYHEAKKTLDQAHKDKNKDLFTQAAAYFYLCGHSAVGAESLGRESWYQLARLFELKLVGCKLSNLESDRQALLFYIMADSTRYVGGDGHAEAKHQITDLCKVKPTVLDDQWFDKQSRAFLYALTDNTEWKNLSSYCRNIIGSAILLVGKNYHEKSVTILRHLAWIYRKGYGVKKDLIEAIRYYAKPCENMYYHPKTDSEQKLYLEVQTSIKESLTELMEDQLRRPPEAVNWTDYQLEFKNRHNIPMAVFICEQVCIEIFHKDGNCSKESLYLYHLGISYMKGYGTHKDLNKALEQYALSLARHEDENDICLRTIAQVLEEKHKISNPINDWLQLGEQYYHGLNQEKNYQVARVCFEKTVTLDKSNMSAVHRLGQLYAYGDDYLSRNFYHAIRYFTIAAHGGNSNSKDSLKKLLEHVFPNHDYRAWILLGLEIEQGYLLTGVIFSKLPSYTKVMSLPYNLRDYLKSFCMFLATQKVQDILSKLGELDEASRIAIKQYCDHEQYIQLKNNLDIAQQELHTISNVAKKAKLKVKATQKDLSDTKQRLDDAQKDLQEANNKVATVKITATLADQKAKDAKDEVDNAKIQLGSAKQKIADLEVSDQETKQKLKHAESEVIAAKSEAHHAKLTANSAEQKSLTAQSEAKLAQKTAQSADNTANLACQIAKDATQKSETADRHSAEALKTAQVVDQKAKKALVTSLVVVNKLGTLQDDVDSLEKRVDKLVEVLEDPIKNDREPNCLPSPRPSPNVEPEEQPDKPARKSTVDPKHESSKSEDDWDDDNDEIARRARERNDDLNEIYMSCDSLANFRKKILEHFSKFYGQLKQVNINERVYDHICQWRKDSQTIRELNNMADTFKDVDSDDAQKIGDEYIKLFLAYLSKYFSCDTLSDQEDYEREIDLGNTRLKVLREPKVKRLLNEGFAAADFYPVLDWILEHFTLPGGKANSRDRIKISIESTWKEPGLQLLMNSTSLTQLNEQFSEYCKSYYSEDVDKEFIDASYASFLERWRCDEKYDNLMLCSVIKPQFVSQAKKYIESKFQPESDTDKKALLDKVWRTWLNRETNAHLQLLCLNQLHDQLSRFADSHYSQEVTVCTYEKAKKLICKFWREPKSRILINSQNQQQFDTRFDKYLNDCYCEDVSEDKKLRIKEKMLQKWKK